MSQDSSSHQILLNPRENIQPTQPWESTRDSGIAPESKDFSVESYADNLMDDLFGDVERSLDIRTPASEHFVIAAEVPHPSSNNSLAFEAANSLAGGMPLAVQASPPDLLFQEKMSEVSDILTSTPENSFNRYQTAPRPYDRLLLGISCISVIVSLAIWLVHREFMQQPVAVVAPPQAASTSPKPVSNVNDQFTEYAQKALQTIDRKAQPNSVGVSPTNASPQGLPTTQVPTLPGMPTTTTTTATASRNPGGLERVYVPIYQIPPNLLPRTTAISPLPSVNPVTPQAVNPPVPLSVPGVARTLKGVVDLGENSAILVDINNVVQRFRIGESIGSSGWTVVEVSKNQALIRRNGEVRSIFVGQSF